MLKSKNIFNITSEHRKVSIIEYANGQGFEVQKALDQLNQGTLDELKFDALHALNWLRYTIRPQTSDNPDLAVATEIWGRLYECSDPQYRAMLRMLLPDSKNHQQCPIQKASALWIKIIQNVWKESPDIQLVDTLMGYIHDDILTLNLKSSNIDDIKKLATYDIKYRIANNLDNNPFPATVAEVSCILINLCYIHTDHNNQERWRILELLDISQELENLVFNNTIGKDFAKLSALNTHATRYELYARMSLLMDYLSTLYVTVQQQPHSLMLPEQFQETVYQA